jgi:Sec-independent protein translocase protein TatA
MSRIRPAWVCFAVFLVVFPAAVPALVGDATAQTRRERQQREEQEREQQRREQELQAQRERQEREQQQREQQQREEQRRQQQREEQRRQQQPTAPPTTQATPAPAEQPPVPVRVVPAPKTEEERAAEREERERWSTLDARLLVLAGLLFLLGAVQVIAFAALALFVGRALRANGRSAQLTERNAMMAQRAFVHVSSLAWNLAGGGVKVSPAWDNNGTTPTRSLRISTNWKAWHGELPADFAYSYTRPPERLFLGPRGQTDVGSVTIPMRDIQAAIEERVQLYFWGRATYEDVFEGSQPHFVEFCHRMDVKGTAPNAIAVSFSHYGPHNRTDEDSQRPAILDER